MKRILLAALVLPLAAGVVAAQDVAFRIDQLELREPHVFTSFIFCLDITSDLNDEFNNSIEQDTDDDGLLDLNLLAYFQPLDQGGAGGMFSFGLAECTAPEAGTSCVPDAEFPLAPTDYVNDGGDPCLVPDPARIRPYSPGITLPGAPCFASDAIDVIISLAGVPVPLESARIAGSYVGDPATAIVSGILEGFISEETANNVIIPEDVPLVGGEALSALLPGGDGNCSSNDDRKLGPDGVSLGWWMYLNFEAGEVPYNPAVAVGEPGIIPIALSVFPNPSPATSRVSFDLDADGPVALSVYDAVGRRVRTLQDGALAQGAHAISWDGRDDDGSRVSAGIYWYRLTADGRHGSGKLVVVR